MRAYEFWTETGTADVGPYPIASLTLRPSNEATASELQMMFRSNMTVDQQLAVAERVLRQVTRWRDGLAEAAASQRTAVDELAEARAEIERLKAGAAGEVHA